MAGNINLRFNAQTNLQSAVSQFRTLGNAMVQLQKQVNATSGQVNEKGEFLVHNYDKLANNIAAARSEQNKLLQASGQYSLATRTLTAETTKFNEQLSRQKVRLRDIWGADNQRMMRSAMKEQMALNNMMVRQFNRDATGKISADIIVPNNMDVKPWQNLRAQAGYYNQVLRSVSQETVNWGKNTQWAGRQLTVGFGVPISIVSGMMMKMALEADASLTRIVKVYGDMGSSFQTTNESIRNMAQDTARYVVEQYGIAAEETRKVMAELAAMGKSGPELQRMTVEVQRTAMLGDLSSEDSLKLNRVLAEVYDLQGNSLREQMNYFNAIENSTALTLQDITEGLPRIAGIMKATGTSIEQQTELMVAMKSAGIDIAEGANALKSINFKAVAASPTAAKAFFNATGVAMDELIEKNNAQFVPMMMDIAKLMEDMSQPQKMNLIARVFGIHQGSRTITLLEQLSQGSESMMRAQEVGLMSTVELARIADREVETIQNSLSTRFKQVVESIKLSMAELGEPLLDVIMPMAEKISDFAQWFADLPETIKKKAAWGALVLAVSGPLIMLMGLIGNFGGMLGRMGSWALELAFAFKILTPESKAAALLQQALQDKTTRATLAIKEQTSSVNLLTEALERQAAAYNSNHLQMLKDDAALRMTDVAAMNQGIYGPLTKAQSEERRLAQMQMLGDTPHPYGMRAGPNQFAPLGVSTYANYRRKAAKAGISGLPATAQEFNVQYAKENAAEIMRIEKQTLRERKKNLVDLSRRGRMALEQQKRQALEAKRVETERVEAVHKGWTRVGQQITVASGAAMGLSMLTGNEMIGHVATYTMAISMIAPAFAQAFDKAKGGILSAGVQGGRVAAGLGDALGAAAMVGKKAFQAFAAFMIGPWGLAIAGGIALLTWQWAKHKKEVNENVKMYERLADTTESLANVYGYTPTSPMERDLQAGKGTAINEDGAYAQRLRIKKLREEEAEMYNDLQRFADQSVKDVGQVAAKTEIIAKAVAEGRKVLQQTGDPEMAKRAAWDMYTVMSNEFMSFDAFKVRVQLDGDSVDQLLNDLNLATGKGASRLATRLGNTGPKGLMGALGFGISKDDKAALETEVIQTLDSVMSITDDQQRREKFETAVGSVGSQVAAAYQDSLEKGLISSDTTVTEFFENIMNIRKTAEEKAYGGGQESVLSQMSREDVLALQAKAQAMAAYDQDLLESMGINKRYLDTYVGLDAGLDEYIDLKKEANLLDQQALAMSRGDTGEVNRIQKLLDAEYALAEAKKEGVDWEKKHDELLYTTGNSMTATGKKGMDASFGVMKATQGAAGSVEALGDEADITGEKLDKLSSRQQIEVDAFRSAAEYGQNNLVDMYVKQFDDLQAAARKRKEDEWAKDIQDIEDRYDAEEEAAEAQDKIDSDRQEARHERDMERLEEREEAAMDALDAREERARKAEQAEEKALSKSHKAQAKALEESQEARRNNIERTYDLQIEKIEAQIEEEERLEEIRQKMFEAEKQRIERLRDMFSSNIDLNMAINSGDLDEAARISNDMRSKQETWAADDLSALSAEGSQTRTEGLQKKIDGLESRRDAELEAIKAVEEAEQEAFEARKEREEEALALKHQRIQEEIEAERKKQQAIFEDLKERLSDSQDAEKESLQQSQEDARETRESNRTEEIAEEQAEIERKRTNLETKQADAKAAFDEEADHWREMVALNETEFKAGNQRMGAAFRTHSKGIRTVSNEDVGKLTKNMETKYKRTVDELEDDAMWEQMAEKIANSIMYGTFGFADWSKTQRRDFIVEGKLPKNPKKGFTDLATTERRVYRHSGGVIGDSRYDKTTGPGFTGKHQEVGLTALKGEGVLNLRAMRRPGVKQLMDTLNSGRTINSSSTGRSPLSVGGGAAPGIDTHRHAGGFAGLGAVIPMVMRRVSEQMLLAGLEIGTSKALDRLSGVNIKLGKNQRQGLDDDQIANAGSIISVGRRLGATQADIITALMTAMQESSLRNIGYGDDRYGVRNPDGSLTSSLGLFQQQNWWGTREERMDPFKSSELFYKALFKVPNREDLSKSQAAQAVQGSAFPGAYAKWESLARVLYGGAELRNSGLVNFGASNAKRLEELAKDFSNIEELQSGYGIPVSAMVSWLYGMRSMFASGPDFHNGLDFRAATGTPVYASGSGNAAVAWNTMGGRYVEIAHPDGLNTGYFHLSRADVRDGDVVRAGQKIGAVGNTGTGSLGPHLHFMMGRGSVWNHMDPNRKLRKSVAKNEWVTADRLGMMNGGTVPGTGTGDIVPAMLEPREFVVKSKVADMFRPLLQAMNAGELDLMPSMAAIQHANPNAAFKRDVDNQPGNGYNIKMEFNGPINSEVDVEKAVRRVINSIERSNPKSRRV